MPSKKIQRSSKNKSNRKGKSLSKNHSGGSKKSGKSKFAKVRNSITKYMKKMMKTVKRSRKSKKSKGKRRSQRGGDETSNLIVKYESVSVGETKKMKNELIDYLKSKDVKYDDFKDEEIIGDFAHTIMREKKCSKEIEIEITKTKT